MPVEIRELIIRAITTADTDRTEDKPAQDRDPDLDREAIIEACVRQVLRILKKKGER